MIKFQLIFFLFIAGINISKAQWIHDHNEQIKFAHYLLKNNLNNDCINLSFKLLSDSSFSEEHRDSLNYFLASAYFKKEINDSAFVFFNRVSSNSVLFNVSHFNAGYIIALMEEYDISKKIIQEIKPSDLYDQELKNIHLAGLSLLLRDSASFSKNYDTSLLTSTHLSTEWKNLKLLSNEIKGIKHKSGIFAGMLSAIVPGLGKVYTGKTWQGLASFMPVVLYGLSAYDSYKRAGFKSPRFILNASIFSLFYIADIWGSVLSVSIKQNEINEKINNQILVNLRIPVSRFYK